MNKADHTSPEHEAIWWTLYYGDRFVSLLLGLPHGVGDYIHSEIEPPSTMSAFIAQLRMRCGRVTGRIIERNQSPQRLPFSATLQLDEEMDSIAALLEQNWWNTSAQLEGAESPLGETRERLLTQANFFHIRMYLHLPYLLQRHSDSRLEHSKITCARSAFELLRRFNILRSEVDGKDLFDCKTNNFVGFTAAVTLLIALSVQGASNVVSSFNSDGKAWTLIQETLAALKSHSIERKCRISTQCFQALETLLQATGLRPTSSLPRDAVTVLIPYFGRISVSYKVVNNTSAGFDPNVQSSTKETIDINTDLEEVYQDNFAGAEVPYDGLRPLENDYWAPEFELMENVAMNSELNSHALTDNDVLGWNEPFVDIDGNWDRFGNA
jgi:hypothetical protein